MNELTQFINGICTVENIDIRQKLARLEDEIRANLALIDFPLRHYFLNGLYCREMFIPRGSVATGKIHKHPCLTIISKGDISLLTEEGIKRIVAPFSLESGAGIKRAVFAYQDTILTTYHKTNETDIAALERLLVVDTYDEYLQFCETIKIEEATKCHLLL